VTKFVSLRVLIAADDDAPIGEVQTRLAAIIEAVGTERLANGNGEPDGASPRVHWGTADVKQGGDRAPVGRSRRAVPGQRSLA
jgi:hypothetical protein